MTELIEKVMQKVIPETPANPDMANGASSNLEATPNNDQVDKEAREAEEEQTPGKGWLFKVLGYNPYTKMNTKVADTSMEIETLSYKFKDHVAIIRQLINYNRIRDDYSKEVQETRRPESHKQNHLAKSWARQMEQYEEEKSLSISKEVKFQHPNADRWSKK